MENNITETNKLIAEFMGAKTNKTALKEIAVRLRDNQIWLPLHGIEHISNLKYHISWDWLMPVVEKIEGLLFDNDNFYNVAIGATCYCIIQDSHGKGNEFIGEEESKILSVYKAVIEFIKWHNKEKSGE